MSDARDFANRLDSALGEGPPAASLDAQRRNVLAAAHRLRRAPSRPRWELALAATVLLGIGAFFLLRPAPHAALSASFRGERVGDHAPLFAALGTAQPLEFSDGSRIVLEANARAELARLSPTHAELELDRGRLSASINHQPGMRWTIAAGPYQVHVVGTKFSVEWDHKTTKLRVAVSEGSVRVSGGDLAAAGVAVAAGQSLERFAPTPAAPPPAVPASPTLPSSASVSSKSSPALATAAVPNQDAPRKASPASSAAPTSSDSARPRDPGFAELSQAGKYREALALAEARGFERLLTELPETELFALGNSARYAGNPARARQALLALRQRFPGRSGSELAALYLARIAEQSDKKPMEAVRWLRIFLQESPTGDLAAGARGSLLSIMTAAGDTAGARAVAEDYLRYHPSGPLAERARSLVARTGSR
jgi:hypothetical protein